MQHIERSFFTNVLQYHPLEASKSTEFIYHAPFPLGEDQTLYRRLEESEQYVSTDSFAGTEMLKVAPEALWLLARTALHNVSFFLRPEHNRQVAAILDDPEASDNDRAVALAMLRNAEIAAKGVLPVCQDTGTAIVMAKKGQQVWTGCDDAEQLTAGIFFRLYRGKPALFAKFGPGYVRGGQHQEQPACPD